MLTAFLVLSSFFWPQCSGYRHVWCARLFFAMSRLCFSQIHSRSSRSEARSCGKPDLLRINSCSWTNPICQLRFHLFNWSSTSTWMHPRFKITPPWSQINSWLPLLEFIYNSPSRLCAIQIETLTLPPPPGKPQAFELLKIGSFKFPPPRAKMLFKMPYPIVAFCLSNAPAKEQSSPVLDVCNKACVYSQYAETSIQEGKLF